jgi:hypothetical protein
MGFAHHGQWRVIHSRSFAELLGGACSGVGGERMPCGFFPAARYALSMYNFAFGLYKHEYQFVYKHYQHHLMNITVYKLPLH